MPELWEMAMARLAGADAAFEAGSFATARDQYNQAQSLFKKAQTHAQEERVRQAEEEKNRQEKAARLQQLHQKEAQALMDSIAGSLKAHKNLKQLMPDMWSRIYTDFNTGSNLFHQGGFSLAQTYFKQAIERLETSTILANYLGIQARSTGQNTNQTLVPAQVTFEVQPPTDYTGKVEMELFHNGQSLGVHSFPYTPKRLLPGRHSFELTRHVMLESKELILLDLTEGQMVNQQVPLTYKPSLIYFDVTPKHAAIRVKQGNLSAVPVEGEMREVSPDKDYTFWVTAQGYQSHKETRSVEKGASETLTVRLKERPKVSIRP
ncbi:MAG: hypothetical protein GKR87_15145 [Kiritimatiellae bacterium]|nr:hypothetical protein [Kiritimatiellia bacterium]